MLVRLIFALVLCGISASAGAQEGAAVARVISASPDSDGNVYSLSVALHDGRQLTLHLQPADAAKIVEGMSRPAGSGAEKRQLVSLVQSMGIHADAEGRFVFLQPRTATGPLQALAIPTEAADRFIDVFQKKASDARTNATRKQQKQ